MFVLPPDVIPAWVASSPKRRIHNRACRSLHVDKKYLEFGLAVHRTSVVTSRRIE
jgi:hypothetical protein